MKLPLLKSKDEFSVLLRKLNEIQRSVDIFTNDMADDRSDISDLKIRMGTVEDQLKELLHRWNSQTERIKEIGGEVEIISDKLDTLTHEDNLDKIKEEEVK